MQIFDMIGRFKVWLLQLGLFRLALLLLGLALLLFVLVVLLRQPSHDRNWRAEIAVMPQVRVDGSVFEIDQVRDWTYSQSDILSQAYHAGRYDLDDLVGTWLMVEPFGGTDAIAHTLILFEFTGARMLALTIEARKEEGEIYSAVKGALNTYELVYLWAEARDVLTRRARYLDHEIFVYPIALSEEERVAFFRALATQTNALYEKPRFYNTLFSNCTNELAKTAGLKWNSAFITTGYAPQHLYKVGTIPGKSTGLAFETLKNAGHVTALIQAADDGDAARFDADFLQAIKARFALGGLQVD